MATRAPLTSTPAKEQTGIAEICSRWDASHASIGWLESIELYATAYLENGPKRAGAKHLRYAGHMAALARLSIDAGNTQGAAMAAMAAMQSAWQAEIAEAGSIIAQGVRMTRGRKSGTEGTLRKAIRAFLAIDSGMKNRELWVALKAKPLRGWEFRETPKLGKYAEGPKGQSMRYKRFSEVALEEREKLTAP